MSGVLYLRQQTTTPDRVSAGTSTGQTSATNTTEANSPIAGTPSMSNKPSREPANAATYPAAITVSAATMRRPVINLQIESRLVEKIAAKPIVASPEMPVASRELAVPISSEAANTAFDGLK